MAYHSKAKRRILITAAATLFATHTRDANEIASLLNTSNRSIHAWSHEPLWTEVLDTLGYTGERNFRVRPSRDVQDNPKFEEAREAYHTAIEQGVPKHKRVRYVCELTGVKNTTIRHWIHRFGWDT